MNWIARLPNNAETKRNAIKEFIDKIVKSKLVSMLMILIHGFSLIKVKSDVHIYKYRYESFVKEEKRMVIKHFSCVCVSVLDNDHQELFVCP